MVCRALLERKIICVGALFHPPRPDPSTGGPDPSTGGRPGRMGGRMALGNTLPPGLEVVLVCHSLPLRGPSKSQGSRSMALGLSQSGDVLPHLIFCGTLSFLRIIVPDRSALLM